VVYLAEQLEPVRREVALKIIRLGMNTEAVITRFEHERKALALMDHPNIARVLDAGSTLSGRPFFVMELVRGKTILKYCQDARLSLAKCLELFIHVCNAIQHAHQKGVIHRDIKASNVLVQAIDGEPVPKVIDFGIAKATAGDLIEESTQTAADQALGTPACMSPEQVMGGGDIDTRTDIYSLGVLLYELIAGKPPFDPKRLGKAGPQEARRIICQEEPEPASKTAGPRLVELDWIIRMAMAKERQHRYDTVTDLAADVRRFLDNEPVRAGPPTRFYRLGKLIRRNRAGFAAATVVVISVLSALSLASRYYLIERQARQEQTSLRQLAELARNNEARLRKMAEHQGLVSQAAVLIRYGDLEAADELLATIPVPDTPSSLEATETFRSLAFWHLEFGRWTEASARFSSGVRSIAEADGSDNDEVSRHLLHASATTCFVDDTEGYNWMRRFAIQRFLGTSHPVVAEQMLKVCLIQPADPLLIDQLRPFAELLKAALDDQNSLISRNLHQAGWSNFSMALMNFRDGSDEQARYWAERTISWRYPNPARTASAKIILAMLDQRAGHHNKAVALINEVAAEVIHQTEGLSRFEEGHHGSWHAWITARVLAREAYSAISPENRSRSFD
jgi:serine/threonine protein kinase